jgi:hypothetical protein
VLNFVLTLATYPILKDRKTGTEKLLNDPNADAYFMIGNKDYVFGGLMDGSGSGGLAYYVKRLVILNHRRQMLLVMKLLRFGLNIQ